MRTLGITWSSEQQAFFDYMRSGKGNVIVEAFAGTGKTTTIAEGINHAPETRILYCVFNKRNQKEAEEKIKLADIKTLHSLGYTFIRKNWTDVKPDPDIEYERAGNVVAALNYNPDNVGMVAKTVGYLKNTTINPVLDNALDCMAEYAVQGESAEEDEQIATCALQVLSASKVKDAQGRISFDDMVWLPVVMQWVRPRYQMVIVDEAQDMNLPQLLMAKGASSGRVVVVGDRRQRIYGFRGAATDGMTMMKITLRAQELKLTTTYRCAETIVNAAREVVPEYKAAPNAPTGSVNSLGLTKALEVLQVGDAVLSRLNAPLMGVALSLIRLKKPARIEGRDIGKQLTSMVKSLKARSVPDFIKQADRWLAKQIQRLAKSKNAQKRIEDATDIAMTLKEIALDCKNVEEILARIEMLFADMDATQRHNCITLSSVHKAKGLEWPRVFLLFNTFRRGKEEEDNIYYVAVTRAMRELYIVGGTTQATAQPAQSLPARNALPTPVREHKSGGGSLPVKPPVRVDFNKIAADADTALAKANRLCTTAPTPGSVLYKRGDLLEHMHTEYVCLQVNECNARFIPTGSKVREIKNRITGEVLAHIKESSRQIAISNSYTPAAGEQRQAWTEEQLQQFLTRGNARRVRNKSELGEQVTKQRETKTETKTESENNMANKNKSAKKGLTGSAEMMRDLYGNGVGKKEAFAKLTAAYPKFEHDEIGLESRWRTAERFATNAEKKKKAAAKTSKGAGKKAPARAKASTKAAPTRKASLKVAKVTAVPARPVPSKPPVRPAAPAAAPITKTEAAAPAAA